MDVFAAVQKHLPDTDPKSVRNNYVSKFEMMYLAIKKTRQMPDLAWLKNKKAVLRAIEGMKLKPSTEGGYLSAVCVGLRMMDGDAARGTKWHKEAMAKRDSIQAVVDAARESRIATAKEEANWVEKELIMAALQKWEKDVAPVLGGPAGSVKCTGTSDLEAFILVQLFVDTPSRNDLAAVKVVDEGTATDSDTNYLVVGKDKLWFEVNQWKNRRSEERKQRASGKTGKVQRLLPISDEEQRLLRLYLSTCSKGPGSWLFVSSRKGNPPLTRNAAGKRVMRFFAKHFKKQVGMTMLRKILLSAAHGESLAKMMADANIYGHSLEQQKLYVRKRKRDSA
jgi:hypothetical protein